MKKVVIVTCMTLLLLGVLELGLRTWAYFFRHSYQRYDVASGIIRLVPNYDRVLSDGRVRVNSKGFRGAEFDAQKPAGVYRIFAVGDSTTFGLPGDLCPYPAQLEQRLNRPGAGRRFEVINAGVEGYNSRDALTVLERDIVRYQPDMVTLYIGWNDMMKHDPGNPGASARFARMSYALYDVYLIKFWRKVMFAWVRPRLQTVQTELPAEAARAYDGYTPHVFKENLERMIEVAGKTGARVVLVTLPSPLRPEMPASEIKKLYFPYYTHNLKAFHLIYSKYNDTIREVAHRRGLPVLDLQASLEGRGELFFDTAHMECEGHAVVAEQFTSLFERVGVVTPATGAVAGGAR